MKFAFRDIQEFNDFNYIYMLGLVARTNADNARSAFFKAKSTTVDATSLEKASTFDKIEVPAEWDKSEVHESKKSKKAGRPRKETVASNGADSAAEPAQTTSSSTLQYTPELLEEFKSKADTFEADRLAHMQAAREAISKAGHPAYLQTLTALSLPNDITAFSDDDVKLHRAAIAHLLTNQE